MWAKIFAVLRTSEFWALVFQWVTQAAALPVPDEFKWATWAYIAFRVVSKFVQWAFPGDGTGPFSNTPKAAAVLLALLIPVTVKAQEAVPLTDISQRAHVTANAGAMYLTKGADWSGASLGGAVLYNLHPQLSAFVGYDHGFPLNDVDDHLNLWRAVGSLRIHPDAFVGFGYAWFDKHTEGGLAQLVITKKVMPKLALGAVYAHIFSRGNVDDFEYARVYLNYHLLGKGN